MAERRMFAKTIIDSDSFLDMPLSSQALYFHLSMRADDEGFVNNPKKIARMIGASDDDFKVIVAKNFVIPFESGIVVIKHWRIHNYIQKDRFKETVYKEERSELELKDNGAYTISEGVYTECIQNVSRLETQDSIGKYRDSIGKVSIEEIKQKHKFGDNSNVLLTDDEIQKLREQFPNDYRDRINRLSYYLASTGKHYKSHYMTILSWARRETPNKNEKKGRLDWIDGISEVSDFG